MDIPNLQLQLEYFSSEKDLRTCTSKTEDKVTSKIVEEAQTWPYLGPHPRCCDPTIRRDPINTEFSLKV